MTPEARSPGHAAGGARCGNRCHAGYVDSAYVFAVEDADADSWSAEVAVVASSPAEASRRIRGGGLHKKQLLNGGRPVRTVSVAGIETLASSPSGIVRRRDNDDGWTTWEPVLEGASLNWRVAGDAVVRGKSSGHR